MDDSLRNHEVFRNELIETQLEPKSARSVSINIPDIDTMLKYITFGVIVSCLTVAIFLKSATRETPRIGIFNYELLVRTVSDVMRSKDPYSSDEVLMLNTIQRLKSYDVAIDRIIQKDGYFLVLDSRFGTVSTSAEYDLIDVTDTLASEIIKNDVR